MVYKGVNIECNYRIDLLVEDKIIIELKAVNEIKQVHKIQLFTYLKITNTQVGLLVNFNTDDILHNIIRIVN